MTDTLRERILGIALSLHDIPQYEAQLIIALRIAAMAQKNDHNPADYVAQRLGSERLANSFSLVMVAIVQAWPENFQLGRPCCSGMTYDELQFSRVFRYAAMNDRRAFDGALAEMLSGDSRDFIFSRMRCFASEYLAS